jgi:prepilin-type N-terminal cleavage/methylation domain-containing protein
MRRGFTFLELMIVIAIIAVISGFVWMGLLGLGHSQELRNAVLVAVATLRDAQQRSVVQQEGYYWGVQFENVEGRDKFTLFRTTTKSADSIEDVNLTVMKPAIELIDPADNSSSTLVFDQISGDLIDCPAGGFEEIKISIVDKDDESQIKIFCNGRVEFQK